MFVVKNEMVFIFTLFESLAVGTSKPKLRHVMEIMVNVIRQALNLEGGNYPLQNILSHDDSSTFS